MWVNRAEYNEFKTFKKKHNEVWLVYDSLKTNFDSLCTQLEKEIREKRKYKEQCEEYKQKYADEVNKRLELIKFYEERSN